MESKTIHKTPSKLSNVFKGLKLNPRKKPKDGVPPDANRVTGSNRSSGQSASGQRHGIPLPPVPSQIDDVISRLSYFHPQLNNKDDVQNFMSQYTLQDGHFLIRRSFKDASSYTITVNHRSGLKHLRILVNEDGRFSLNDRTFETVDELVRFYSHKEIPNDEKIPGILLRFPIKRQLDFGQYIVVNESQPTPGNRRPTELPYNRIGSPYDRPNINYSGDTGVRLPASPNLPPTGPRIPVAPRLTPTGETATGRNEQTRFQYNTTDTTPPVPPPKKHIVGTPIQVPVPVAEVTWVEKCDCGLPVKESELPSGWSVHVSQEPDTKDHLFFLSPTVKTHWELPLDVCLQLSAKQKAFLQDLMKRFKVTTESAFSACRQSCADTVQRSTRSGEPSDGKSSGTWVSCDDYESSKSLRAKQQGHESGCCAVQATDTDTDSDRGNCQCQGSSGPTQRLEDTTTTNDRI